jgi:hypothetical protein
MHMMCVCVQEINPRDPSKPPPQMWSGELEPEEERGPKRSRVDISYGPAADAAHRQRSQQQQQQQQQQQPKVEAGVS